MIDVNRWVALPLPLCPLQSHYFCLSGNWVNYWKSILHRKKFILMARRNVSSRWRLGVF